VRPNGKSGCVRKQYGPFASGDLISAVTDVNAVAELYSLRPVCLLYFFLRVYTLEATLAIQPSSGASIGVPTNSLQMARSGNIPKRYICRLRVMSYSQNLR
jgi:hypothetical protein